MVYHTKVYQNTTLVEEKLTDTYLEGLTFADSEALEGDVIVVTAAMVCSDGEVLDLEELTRFRFS